MKDPLAAMTRQRRKGVQLEQGAWAYAETDNHETRVFACPLGMLLLEEGVTVETMAEGDVDMLPEYLSTMNQYGLDSVSRGTIITLFDDSETTEVGYRKVRKYLSARQ